MIKKQKIEKKLKRKTKPSLVSTIIKAKKNKNWLKIADIISRPKRKQTAKNLSEIDKKSEQGGKVVIPGKVLSKGELTKKIKIVALSFSQTAKEKIKKAGGEAIILLDEINKNPDAKGLKILE